ncbi:hypothetical protein B0F90DRAFT_589642 [Multifurca ochricompacta]|uniref:Uncharacterized protein n=1 Tax=Multifurca ochricompacta TaxID=376703 RepID=A0AAD4QKE1_9AGAM|nr:hypothetical protein B0F90DRAFT_589642 [Multifurca ochricompacta]
MLRPSIPPQSMIPINQPFLSQQHGQSAPMQPHNLNLLPGANQGVNFLQTHPPNGSFSNPQLAQRIRFENRQRDLLAQSQRATAGGGQTGPPVMNGVVPVQPPGVGYPGMVPQNGQGPVQRVVSQPVGVGAPLTASHPNSHPVNPGLGMTGGLQTPRSGPQSQPQQQIGMRPGQSSLPGQPGAGQIRPPPIGMPGMPPGSGMRGPGGMGVNMPSGIIGNVPPQAQPQQGFPNTLSMGGPTSQPPPQGPQPPSTSMSQSMHRTLSTPEGTNSFGGMPGFTSGPFSQGGPHPPTNHISGPNSANQFGFMPPTSSPSQHMDMAHSLSSGGAGPSSTSPTRSDFTVTPAQYASLQHGSGVPSGSGVSGTNEGFPTFSTVPPPRPSSSSHSALGLPHQQAQTSQGLSRATPPRQHTPHQQPHMSPAHLPDRFSVPIPNPTRPQSQPQRPSSQQQMGPSLTPHLPPGTLPRMQRSFRGTPQV